MRKWTIFGLTHFYPLFIAAHLYLGDWCRKCQVMFNVVPLLVFGGLFYIVANTGRLAIFERSCIEYLIFNLVFIQLYYCICVFSLPLWVYDKNYQVAVFVIITLIFYIYKHCGHK